MNPATHTGGGGQTRVYASRGGGGGVFIVTRPSHKSPTAGSDRKGRGRDLCLWRRFFWDGEDHKATFVGGWGGGMMTKPSRGGLPHSLEEFGQATRCPCCAVSVSVRKGGSDHDLRRAVRYAPKPRGIHLGVHTKHTGSGEYAGQPRTPDKQQADTTGTTHKIIGVLRFQRPCNGGDYSLLKIAAIVECARGVGWYEDARAICALGGERACIADLRQ